MFKVGIIGLGVGEKHIEGYLSHPECKIKSLCDFNDEVFEKAVEKYPDYNITKDANDILEDPEIDIVSIASWDNYHHEQIIKGIKNNKHLFIEKPICLYEDELSDIIKNLQKKPELKISSNLILRKSERFSDLKTRINNNEFGPLSYIKGGYNYGRIHKLTDGWRGKIDFYSVVYGGGIHLIDLMKWLTNDKIIEVSSFGNNIQTKETDFKYNDMVISLLKFESGLVASLSSNLGCVHPHFHQLEIYGTKATFINDFEDALLFDERNSNEHKLIDTAYPGHKKGDFIYGFVDSIDNNCEPEVSEKDIFDTMAVCFAIEKATKSGNTEKVNYLDFKNNL